MAPPQEKPPPLPANPPPDLVDRKTNEEENEIDKQEREIIESLEREEKEHKKYLESITLGSTELTTTSISTNNTSFSSDNHHVNNTVSQTTTTQSQQTTTVGASTVPDKQSREEPGNGSEAPSLHPKKKEKAEVKDYSKHWLIQEAEQRRISEAKQ